MTGCGRASILLEHVSVDVFTDSEDTSWLESQCLVDDNPGKVTIHIKGDPRTDATGDLVIVVKGVKEYPYGFLARVVNELDKSKQPNVTYENATAYWRY
jgi:hypothetical protein